MRLSIDCIDGPPRKAKRRRRSSRKPVQARIPTLSGGDGQVPGRQDVWIDDDDDDDPRNSGASPPPFHEFRATLLELQRLRFHMTHLEQRVFRTVYLVYTGGRRLQVFASLAPRPSFAPTSLPPVFEVMNSDW